MCCSTSVSSRRKKIFFFFFTEILAAKPEPVGPVPRAPKRTELESERTWDRIFWWNVWFCVEPLAPPAPKRQRFLNEGQTDPASESDTEDFFLSDTDSQTVLGEFCWKSVHKTYLLLQPEPKVKIALTEQKLKWLSKRCLNFCIHKSKKSKF